MSNATYDVYFYEMYNLECSEMWVTVVKNLRTQVKTEEAIKDIVCDVD